MIQKKYIVIAVMMVFASCANPDGARDNKTLSDSSWKRISLNAKGDTEFVTLQHSGIRLIMHYYNNKPQGILLQDDSLVDSLKSHYTKGYKGIFVNINPETGLINSVGYRYLHKDEGVDIAIDSSGKIDFFTNWEQYSNNGKSYSIKEDVKGEIIVYTISD